MWQKSSSPAETRSLAGQIPIHHRYTLGVAGERFFKAMRDEARLLTSHCPRCHQRFLPPKIYCEICFEETDTWSAVEGNPTLKTFTVVHLDLDEEPLQEPEMVGFFAWPGVRGGLVHRIREVDPQSLKTGIAMELVWAPERTGAMTDILYFRPA